MMMMNKIDKMFLSQGVVWEDDVEICTDIVKQVAIKYQKYFSYKKFTYFDNTENGDVYKDKKGDILNEDEIFEKFIKTL